MKKLQSSCTNLLSKSFRIMTRQEEISNAKMAFYDNMLRDSYPWAYDKRDCFEEGAKWADEHPKSLWISVKDDLPYNYPNNIRFGITNNVIATDGTSIFILHMKRCKDNKWIWCGDDSVDDTVYSVVFSNSITHWMPFPKPPKK